MTCPIRFGTGLDDAKNTARICAQMVSDGCLLKITKSIHEKVSVWWFLWAPLPTTFAPSIYVWLSTSRQWCFPCVSPQLPKPLLIILPSGNTIISRYRCQCGYQQPDSQPNLISMQCHLELEFLGLRQHPKHLLMDICNNPNLWWHPITFINGCSCVYLKWSSTTED